MTILFVSTGAWGSGLGRRLTVTEHDNNNWQFASRLAALEGATAYAGITGFGVTGPTGSPGTLFTVEMSDGSSFGPYALPVAQFRSHGAYAGGASFTFNDIFTVNGSLYIVNVPHVSPTGFNPSLNDGAGHDYYSQLIPTPAGSLPTGGVTGYNLRKLSSNNFDVGWAPPLPIGGSTGQYLAKNSSVYFDAGWIDPPWSPPATGAPGYVLGCLSTGIDDFDWVPPVPLGGGTGFALVKLSDVDFDVGWSAPIPVGGSSGYVLTKNSDADFDVAWMAPSGGGGGGGGLPTGGATGMSLVKHSGSDGDVEWKDLNPVFNTDYYGVAASGTINFNGANQKIFYVRPGGDCSFNADTAPEGILTFIFITDGTTPYNITFDGGFFATQGTFNTGSVSGSKAVIMFIGNGSSYWEAFRTGPY
jgi:hypothetical protein